MCLAKYQKDVLGYKRIKIKIKQTIIPNCPFQYNILLCISQYFLYKISNNIVDIIILANKIPYC